MSFAKAQQLLRLATMAAGRRFGVTISDVIEEFGGVERTAQRHPRTRRGVEPPLGLDTYTP